MERLLRALRWRGSLAGLVLGVGAGVVLAVSGLVSGPLAALPVAAALVAVVLLAPGGRVPDLSIAATDDEVQVREALDRMMIALRFKVADDLMDEVKRVRASIMLTLEVESGRVAGDPTVHLIRRTALDYLPTALAAYLKLPRVEAEQRAVADGRTPHDVLIEQLQLMEVKMREAADAILAHDSEALLANGRFLVDRFATSSLSQSVHREVAAPAPMPVETVEMAQPAQESEKVH